VAGHANPYFRGSSDDYNMNNFKDEVKGCIDNYLKPYMISEKPTVEFSSSTNENSPQIATTITLPSSLPTENWYSILVELPCKPLWFSLDNAYCVSSRYASDGRLHGADQLTLIQSENNDREQPIKVHLHVADDVFSDLSYAEDVCKKTDIEMIQSDTKITFGTVDPLQLLPAVRVTEYSNEGEVFTVRGTFTVNKHAVEYIQRGAPGDALHSIVHEAANNEHVDLHRAVGQILDTAVNNLPVFSPNPLLRADLLKLANDQNDVYKIHIPETCVGISSELTNDLDQSLVLENSIDTVEGSAVFVINHEKVIEMDVNLLDFEFKIEMDCSHDFTTVDNWWTAMFRSLFYSKIAVQPPLISEIEIN